jgi:hypothetical protein
MSTIFSFNSHLMFGVFRPSATLLVGLYAAADDQNSENGISFVM